MDAGLDILALTSRGGNQIEQQVNYRIRLSREKATLIPVNIPRRGFVEINILMIIIVFNSITIQIENNKELIFREKKKEIKKVNTWNASHDISSY